MTDPSHPLSNARHERFAQEVAKGSELVDAYVLIGFKHSEANARRLKSTPAVRDRIAWLQARRAERQVEVEVVATAIAAEKLAITKERVLGELAKIAFADLRKAVKWGPAVRVSDEDGAKVITSNVELVESAALDNDTAAAIAEVRQGAQGQVSIKMHDKRAALVDLGKHLGLFIQRHEIGAPGDFERLSDQELLDAVTKEAAELGIALPETTTAH